MKKTPFILVLFGLLLTLGCSPQLTQTTEKFFPEYTALPKATPALKKEKGYTNYTEMMGFLDSLKLKFPQKIRISFLGNSKNGLAIPMAVIGNSQNLDRVRIWMQGGLHGDEPAGTESILLFMHELLHSDSLTYLLDKCVFAFVPMANIDGYLKNERRNAEGLDLNRDQTKLMAAESINLKEAFTEFKPDIAMDLHEYRPFRKDFVQLSTTGVTSAYDVMFLYSGNLNVPESLRLFTRNKFVNPTLEKLNNHGYTHHDYVTSHVEKGDIHFNQGSNNARSSATNFALQHTVSTLLEVRGVGIGRTSFHRRVHIGYLVALSYSKIASELSDSELNAIRSHHMAKQIMVRSKRAVYQDTLTFIDLDKNELLDLPVTIKDAWQSKATLARNRPKQYAIDATHGYLIPKIVSYGLQVDTLKADALYKTETFTVSYLKKAVNPYEKVYLQEVKTTILENYQPLKAGTFLINTNQKSGNILPELLEPEAPNSFVSFGLIQTAVGKTLPIYRILP